MNFWCYVTKEESRDVRLWQVFGFWKHPESWNSTVYGWKTKPASFKKKNKLQALFCCLLTMQIAFTTNSYFITLAVCNFRPEKVPQTYHNNSYSKGVIEVEVSIRKIAFHNLTRELSRINSLQSSYFDKCGKVFWPLETGNISSYFIL